MSHFPELGVGLLIHNSQRYSEFLEVVAGEVDVMELILGQYEEEPSTINHLKNTWNKPMIMHNSFFTFGTDTETNEKILNKINDRNERADAKWVSDHCCFTGVPGTAVGALLPPILDEKQLEVMIRRVKEAKAIVKAPIVLENVVLHYQIGQMPYAEFMTRLAEEADIGLLISMENITQSKHYVGFDHYEFIDALPAERIVEVHCTLGNSQEQKSTPFISFNNAYEKQLMHYEVLEYLAKVKKVKPKALIWELETETPSLPEASEFIERVQWAKELFSYGTQGVALS